MDFTEFKRNIRRDLRRQRHWKITILTAFSLVIGNIRNSVMTMWHNIILQQVAHEQRVAALADTRQVFLRIRKGERDGIHPGVLPTPAAYFFRSKKVAFTPCDSVLDYASSDYGTIPRPNFVNRLTRNLPINPKLLIKAYGDCVVS